MPPVVISKKDDCSIRHDRPTFNTFVGLHTGATTVSFNAFRAMSPSFVPETFLKKRYADVPVNAPPSDFEYAAKLATADFGYRNHMMEQYERVKAGLPPKRNVVGRVSQERRAGADQDLEVDDNMLPQMD